MITNILAAVVITLITNVVSSDNTVWVDDPFLMLLCYPPRPAQRIGTPATERYQTTTVTEHTVVTLTVKDMPLTFASDRLLSSVTAIQRKQEEWKDAGVKTNSVAPPSQSIVLWTNWHSLTNITISP